MGRDGDDDDNRDWKGERASHHYKKPFISVLYGWESIMAIHHLPQTQNNVVKYCLLQFACK